MIGGKKATASPDEHYRDQYAAREQRIAEMAVPIAVAREKLARATSAEDATRLRAQIEFSEIARSRLINEHIELEIDKLQRRVSALIEADSSRDCERRTPALIEERERLYIRLNEIEKEIRSGESSQRRSANAISFAEQVLQQFESKGAAALRARLQRSTA
jgi:hypothetical protein